MDFHILNSTGTVWLRIGIYWPKSIDHTSYIKVDIICNLKVAITFWVMLKERVFN